MSEDIKDRSRLKGLYAQRSQLQEKLDRLNKDKVFTESQIKYTENKLSGIQGAINKYENGWVRLTQHAIDRYRERIKEGATSEEIYNHLLTPQLMEMVKTLGNGIYPIDGIELVIEDHKIITLHRQGTKEQRKERSKMYNRKQRQHGK